MQGRLIEHDEIIEDGEWQQSEEQKAFNSFKEQTKDSESGRLKVYRLPESEIERTGNAATVKPEYLFACAVDQYEYDELLEAIRMSYGGGWYRLVGTLPGKPGVRMGKVIKIGAPLKSDKPDGIGGLGRESVGELMRTMTEMQRQLEERYKTAAQPPDPMQQMTTMFTMMKGMREAMGLGDVVQQQGMQQPDILGELQKIKTIGEMLGWQQNNENENSVFATLIREVGAPVIKSILASGGAIPGVPRLAPPQTNPLDLPDSPTASDGAEPTKEEKEQMNSLKIQCVALENFAKHHMTPDDVATRFLDSTPETHYDSLYEFIAAPECIQVMVAIHAPLSAHVDWLKEVKAAILLQFEEINPAVDASGIHVVEQPLIDTGDGDTIAATGKVDDSIKETIANVSQSTGPDTTNKI